VPSISIDLDQLPHSAQAYARGGYLEVEGWGVDDHLIQVFVALDHIQRTHHVSGNLLEIGVHHGRTFALLAQLARGDETSFAIDLFEDQARNLDHSGLGDSSAFLQTMTRHAPGTSYRTIVGDSLFLDFAAEGITRVRFAHVDGAHYVDAVINDLMKVQDVIVAGGVVVVDDFLHSGFPGVAEACHRYLSSALPRKLVPFAVGRNKLFLTTHSHHSTYVESFGRVVVPPAGRVVTIHGYSTVCVDEH
jgi:hypothetical protein